MKPVKCEIDMTRYTLLTAVAGLTLLFAACTTDSYETGEGTYSRMVADFAELKSNDQKQGVSFVTDDGVSYALESAYTAWWILKEDSTYRTSIYYIPLAEGRARIKSCSNIPTLRAKKASEMKQQPQDPINVESCWLSKSGKYLNMALLMKNGRYDNGKEGVHQLTVVLDESHKNADNTITNYYRLLHDKGTALDYYTNRYYVSMALPAGQRPDSVRLSIKTYDGVYVKTVKI